MLSKEQSTLKLKIIFVILILVLVSLFVLLIQQYKNIQSLNYTNPRQFLNRPFNKPKPLNITDVNSIQSWMTFDYINHVFLLPPEYLRTVLLITNNRYPKITIIQYSKDIKSTQNDTLIKVQNAIKNFFIPKK